MSQNVRARRILVVEDDIEVATLLQSVLRSYGYEVEIVDELTVLEASREQLPDLIILDLLFPDVSGAEMGRALHALPETSAIPIVLMSGAEDVAARAAEIDAVGYLHKPFDLDQLLSTVERALAAD